MDRIENRPQQGLQYSPQPLQKPEIPALPRAAQEREPCPEPCPSDWGMLWGATTLTFLLNSFYFAHKYSLNQRQHKQFYSLVTSTFTRNKSLVFSLCSSEYLGRRRSRKKNKGKIVEDSVQQGAEPWFLADQDECCGEFGTLFLSLSSSLRQGLAFSQERSAIEINSTT